MSLASPANGSSYTTPANIALAATATDSDGIAQVEFLIDGVVYATDTAAPYEATWTNATVGSHQIVARATDSLGAVASSTAVNITVNAAPITYYYLETDQLGTPRLASDAAGVTVWRWDNTDPFGYNVADEDPDGNGQNVSINLRFPGQYFDKETGLHYNYFRDYDPSTGRYVQSDPIGLEGGINTYAYVGGNPINYVDSLGLITKRELKKRLNTTCDNGIWQSLISGDVEELSTRLAACAVDEDVDDLMQLCERYKIGKGLKKQHESELARRLGVNVDEFHKELKKELIRKRKGDLMDHGMGKNPDLLLDKNGAPYLRDVSSGKTIPVEW